MNKRIVFVGGDIRQVYAAEKLREKGLEVFLYGFDKLNAPELGELEDFYSADIIVLPVTGLRDGVVPVYYSDKEIKLDADKLKNKLVIIGKARTLGATECCARDLLEREDFALRNAVPSAEGAVLTAMENFDGTISGSRCLVVGYGRIGAALAKMLKALNAEVTVASRKDIKRYSSVFTSEINDLNGYDVVFNTADALIINENILRNSDNKTLIIDLASQGGVDFEVAKALGFKAIHALGLPGRYSPKTAGEIISDIVLTILEEE